MILYVMLYYRNDTYEKTLPKYEENTSMAKIGI